MSERILLIVDDDDDIVDTVRMILQRQGWRVESASDGAGGLAQLRAGLRPAAVLLDLMMPGINGWQFCDALRADPQLCAIRVVVVSGAGDVAEKARSVGAIGHLRKPFELSELIEVVKALATYEEPAAPL
jgi:CheY-like chemotaxis protein